jgi:hypothetical protein
MTLGTRPVSELLCLLDENMTLGDLLYFAVIGRKEHAKSLDKSKRQRRKRKEASGHPPTPPATLSAPGAAV